MGLDRLRAQTGLDHARPVAHGPQAQPFVVLLGQTDPVIGDLENNQVVPAVEADLDVPGLAVLEGIGTRFPGN
jgi:hypothetical protein